ncbi:MAG: ribonuclease HI [Proteobacteria bacterium]|nr:ribonuclease HI [Pseudomonadota bacterium]MBU1648397.1 ribonuclease HI [Pseudomonadota bacterium]
MTKKKVYAVAAGLKPGIYDNWPEAEKQVKGYAGAKFKGFTDRDEAEAWLKNRQYNFAPVKKEGREKTGPMAVRPPRDGEINIYTDGGCSNNPGPGGYGAIIVSDGQEQEISGGFRLTTNNRMELMACIVALRSLEDRDRPITVWSDSSYVVNGISKGWARGWRRRGWIKSDKQPAVNPDLWAELLELVEELDVTFQWVRGHAGHPLNERCDQLAVAALKEKNLPVDKGYPGQ